MLAYVLATETLRLANKSAGKQLLSWRTLSSTNEPVLASNSVLVEPDSTDWRLDHDANPDPDLILLCAGYNPLNHVTPRVRSYLSRVKRSHATIGGVDTGSVILAQLGLLDGYRAVLHYEAEAEFRERWPDISISDHIYSLDRSRLTAAGGTATGDAVLAWLAREFGGNLAKATSDAMAHGKIRSEEERQRILEINDPVLANMEKLMKENLNSPLPLARICARLGITHKQLRRRCCLGFGRTPSAHYLHIRLAEASYLLSGTLIPITDVALMTGFGSLSGFSRTFKAHFHVSPRDMRKARQKRI